MKQKFQFIFQLREKTNDSIIFFDDKEAKAKKKFQFSHEAWFPKC